MSMPTFPAHPHAGFSAVSYVFEDAQTGIRNQDSMGSDHVILPGGVHWAVAGSGMVHQEDPAEAGKTVHSLQVFVRLPKGQEHIAPFAVGLPAEKIPEVAIDGGKVRVVAGGFGGALSPLNPPTEVDILDIFLDAGASLSVPVPNDAVAVVLPIRQTVHINGQGFWPEDLTAAVLMAKQHQGVLALSAPEAAQAVVFIGKPID